MWIALMLLIFLILAAIAYFGWRKIQQIRPAAADDLPCAHPPQVPGSGLPSHYFFHWGHTWALECGRCTARVGVDAFAANLLGQVEKIAVSGEQRWVRQGQKLITLTCGGETLEMPSPIEGVVTAINPEVIKDPGLAVRDPYQQGWVCAIKSPEMEVNLRNLASGALATSWMQYSVTRLKSLLLHANPELAQDGGLPVGGLLRRLSSALRQQIVKEFFLG
jgi:glycine cleavage system H lipoate-binding protein